MNAAARNELSALMKDNAKQHIALSDRFAISKAIINAGWVNAAELSPQRAAAFEQIAVKVARHAHDATLAGATLEQVEGIARIGMRNALAERTARSNEEPGGKPEWVKEKDGGVESPLGRR